MPQTKDRVSYFYDAEVGSVYYGPNHPMKPHRLCMTRHLVMGYDLHKQMELYRPRKALPGCSDGAPRAPALAERVQEGRLRLGLALLQDGPHVQPERAHGGRGELGATAGPWRGGLQLERAALGPLVRARDAKRVAERVERLGAPQRRLA